VLLSDANAVKWWAKSAEQDHPVAQYRLSEMYYRGSGVTQSMTAVVEVWIVVQMSSYYRIPPPPRVLIIASRHQATDCLQLELICLL
jgi:TPR repeat protein